MNAYKSGPTWFLIISVAVHLAIFAFLSQVPKRNPPPIEVKPSYVKIVRIAPQKSTVSKLLTKGKGASVGNLGKKPGRKLRYSDLLQLPPPSAYKEEATGGNKKSKTPYDGDKLGELLAGASDFSANFDLPLVLRRSITDGNAWANLSLKKNHIEVEYLGGHKEIRAALFESLKAPKSYRTLLSAFDHFQTHRLKITIQYETRFVSQSDFEFKTERKVYDDELEITMRRYTQALKYGVTGIVLEDKHSRMAKKRDRRHWSQLIQSVAYRKPVRNFKLSAP